MKTPETRYRVALINCHRERIHWIGRTATGVPAWVDEPPAPLPLGKAEILRREEAMLSRCFLKAAGACLDLVEAES